MTDSKFKQGDLVFHKTTKKFEMVVIDNSYFENPTIRQMADKNKNPNRYKCKYYNPDNKAWEINDFYEWELESASE